MMFHNRLPSVDADEHRMGDIIKPAGLDVGADVLERDGVDCLFLVDQDVAFVSEGGARDVSLDSKRDSGWTALLRDKVGVSWKQTRAAGQY